MKAGLAILRSSAALGVVLGGIALLVQGCGGDGGPPELSPQEQLGKSIFNDANLSLNRNQPCAACHDLAWGGTGGHPATNAGGAVYEGSVAGRFGNRKPPSIAYAAISPVLLFDAKSGFVGGNFWDGRATGLRLGNPAAEQAQGPFIDGMTKAGSGGIEVGAGQASGMALPAGVPAPVAEQIHAAAQYAFSAAFTDAMRPTMVVPIVVILLAAGAVLLVKSRPAAEAENDSAVPQPEATRAG